MIIAALDPGREYAVALGREGRLISVLYQPDPRTIPADQVVVEFPKYYTNGAPPRSVIEIAFAAGFRAAQLGAVSPDAVARVDTVSQPKAVVADRVYRTLDPIERDALDRGLSTVPKSYQNNCTDAVRHLLVYLGRW